MTDLFDFERPADAYAVLGNPIAHSKSPRIHAAFARQTRQRLTYTAILVEPGAFDQTVGNFRASGGKGLNVTVPFKRDAWRYVDTRSPVAERAGAVNTIVFRSDGSSFGDNTDGAGLVRDLLQNYGLSLEGKRILLLGAGGAARGVLVPLLEQRPAVLMLANRTPGRADELAREFAGYGPTAGGGFERLAGECFDLVINATSASLLDSVPPLPDGVLAPGAWCYDMVYGEQPTAFMRWAVAHGAARAVDGLGMLVEQAAESFYLWRGVRPDTQPVIAELARELGRV